MNREEVTRAIQDPGRLEEYYRQDPDKFTDIFPEIYRENPGSVILQVWQERLFYSEPESRNRETGKKQIILTTVLAILAGFLVRLPGLTALAKEEWFYPRYPALIILAAISVYFLINYKASFQTWVTIALSYIVIFILLALLPFPANSDTFVLSCAHFVLVSWFLLLMAYSGEEWRSDQKRIEYIRFNGDLIIFTSIILIGGAVLTGITVTLFHLIGLEIEEWYVKNIVVMGLAAAPIVATNLTDLTIGGKTRIASTIARIFMPLFLATVLIYLLFSLIQQKSPYSDRNFLIVFNLLLVIVLSISIFSIIESSKNSISKFIKYINVALIITTLLVDIIALSAIIFRLGEFGISPNRIAVLGANLLIFIHLCGFIKPYIGILSKDKAYSDLEHWTARYLPIYPLWGLVVAVGFPFIFGFK